MLRMLNQVRWERWEQCNISKKTNILISSSFLSLPLSGQIYTGPAAGDLRGDRVHPVNKIQIKHNIDIFSPCHAPPADVARHVSPSLSHNEQYLVRVTLIFCSEAIKNI